METLQKHAWLTEAKELCNCICVDIGEIWSSKHLVAIKLFNMKYFTMNEIFKNEQPTVENTTTKSNSMADQE